MTELSIHKIDGNLNEQTDYRDFPRRQLLSFVFAFVS